MNNKLSIWSEGHEWCPLSELYYLFITYNMCLFNIKGFFVVFIFDIVIEPKSKCGFFCFVGLDVLCALIHPSFFNAFLHSLILLIHPFIHRLCPCSSGWRPPAVSGRRQRPTLVKTPGHRRATFRQEKIHNPLHLNKHIADTLGFVSY